MFTPIFGEMIQFDFAYFSDGLKLNHQLVLVPLPPKAHGFCPHFPSNKPWKLVKHHVENAGSFLLDDDW